MNELSQYSDADLAAELLRREMEQRKRPQPKPREAIKIDHIIDVCEECIEHIAKHGRYMKDGEHWVYESAMTAIYGQKVWDWIREQVS